MYDTSHHISHRDGEEITKFPDELRGQACFVEEVTNCEVNVLDWTETLTIHACRDSVIRCGPATGVCKISSCSSCEISVASGHVLIADCQNLKLFLYTASEPEVERSVGIIIGPYNLQYPGLAQHFSEAELEPRKNLWSRVRADADYGTAWKLLPGDQFVLAIKELRGLGPPEDVVPRHEQYGGTIRTELIVGSQERSNRSSLTNTRTPRKPLPNTDNYAFRYRENEELIKMPGEVVGHPFTLEDIRGCDVSLLDVTETLDIRTCKDTTIRCGPTKGICNLSDCSGSMVTVACGHLIVKNCYDLILFVYSSSEPEIEKCSQVTFAPYNLAYAGLSAHFLQAGLEPRKNLWSRVRSTGEYGLNWSLLPESEFFLDRKEIPGAGIPEDPVPRPERYGGTVKGEIQTGSIEMQRGATPAILYELPVEQPHPPEAHYSTPRKSFQPPLAAAVEGKKDGTSGIDSKPAEVTVMYDEETGFSYAREEVALAHVPYIHPILMEIEEEVREYHSHIAMLKVSTYALVSSTLLLYLIVILLHDFMYLHLAGLIINLIIVTAYGGVLSVLLVMSWRGKKRLCQEAMGVFLSARKSEYDGLGIEVLADVDRVLLRGLPA